MAVPFIRIGLGVADKLVDKHFEKFNDDLFTPGRRKNGLKRLATRKKNNEVAKMARAAGEAKEATKHSDESEEDSDEADYSERDSRERERERGRERSGRARRDSARSNMDAYRSRRTRSVDEYYHPDYDYTHDPRYAPTPFAPYPPQQYAQDPYAQERRRTYSPPRASPPPESRQRPRAARPGLQKRSSSVGDVRRGRDRPRQGLDDKAARNVEKRDKEGKLSLIAAGVLAGGAILLSR